MNEILNKYQAMLPPVVIHCFTGNRHEAIKYIGMGYYIGITGKISDVILFCSYLKLYADSTKVEPCVGNTNFIMPFVNTAGYIWKDQEDGIQSLLRDDDMPLDKLLIETDAPFMFPFIDKVGLQY